MIMTGRRETTVKEWDVETRHKSRDGNACHIDEATAREVGNGVSSASCLPVSLLGALTPIFIAFFCLVFLCLCIHLFFSSNLPLLHCSLYNGTLFICHTCLSTYHLSFPPNSLQFTTKLFLVKGMKPGPFKACLCYINAIVIFI